ncbi:MAG: EF-hand domain-containing protein [Parvularculaceae bacterium]|nr:EF-hand domain-containing protein [Parvularculaceae bacterium]
MNLSSLGGFNPSQIQQKIFQKFDADQSGGVSLDELKKAGPPPGAPEGLDVTKLFSTLDKDGDGQLAQTELKPPSGGPSGLSSEVLSSLFSSNAEAEDPLLSLFKQPDASTSKTAADLSQLIDVLKQLGGNDDSSSSQSSSGGAYSFSSVGDVYQTLLKSLNVEGTEKAFA